MSHGSRKAIIAAFFANLGIAIAKAVGFLFTGSASMLAEAIHSVADTANQALLLLGARLARKQATPEHPFGFGRERFFWAFVVALILFALGSLASITEGIDKLRHPHELESPLWAIGILLVGLLMEGASLRTAVIESNRVRGKVSWWSFIRRSKIPELPVVLLEDLGALIGLALALLGIGLAMLTGDARFDALGSLAIGILLGVIAVVLAIEMRSLLLGEAASQKTRAAIQSRFEANPSVVRLIHMRTEHIGPEELLVAAKLEFDSKLSFRALSACIDTIEVDLRAAIPMAKIIYLEPDAFHQPNDPA